MFVCSVIINTSAVEDKVMRWKAFFTAMFSWRGSFRLFSDFPLETLIFYTGGAAVVILIKQC